MRVWRKGLTMACLMAAGLATHASAATAPLYLANGPYAPPLRDQLRCITCVPQIYIAPIFGTVRIDRIAPERLSFRVELRNALPLHTFNVHFWGGFGSTPVGPVLTTNALGSATYTFRDEVNGQDFIGDPCIGVDPETWPPCNPPRYQVEVVDALLDDALWSSHHELPVRYLNKPLQVQ